MSTEYIIKAALAGNVDAVDGYEIRQKIENMHDDAQPAGLCTPRDI